MGMILLATFVLAFLAESLTEYIFAYPFKKFNVDRELLKYIALAVGISMAFAYRLDLLREYFELVPIYPWIGWVLTGCIVGRGANFVHDLASKYIWNQPGPDA